LGGREATYGGIDHIALLIVAIALLVAVAGVGGRAALVGRVILDGHAVAAGASPDISRTIGRIGTTPPILQLAHGHDKAIHAVVLVPVILLLARSIEAIVVRRTHVNAIALRVVLVVDDVARVLDVNQAIELIVGGDRLLEGPRPVLAGIAFEGTVAVGVVLEIAHIAVAGIGGVLEQAIVVVIVGRGATLLEQAGIVVAVDEGVSTEGGGAVDVRFKSKMS